MLKNIYLRVALGFLAAITLFLTINVITSPQMALFKMLQAVKQDNVANFDKFYAVAQPKVESNLPEGAEAAQPDSKTVMAEFKDKYYQDLSFQDALFLKKLSEGVSKGTVNAGTLLFVERGSDKVVYRMARTNGGWQIQDIAKLDQ